jgi:hypothetical protein
VTGAASEDGPSVSVGDCSAPSAAFASCFGSSLGACILMRPSQIKSPEWSTCKPPANRPHTRCFTDPSGLYITPHTIL